MTIKTGGGFNYALAKWLKEIRNELQGAVIASALSGVAAPFVRKVFPKRLGFMGFDWPTLDEGLAWLFKQKILTERQVAAIAREQSQTVDDEWNTFEKRMQTRMQDLLAESISAGDSREDWAKRLAEQDFPASVARHAEAIGRTYTHNAYGAGVKSVLDDSVVGELFPYWEYAATGDSRTRPEHAAMNGKIAHRSSPLAAEMERLSSEYGCRCTLIPIDREEALSRGIDDDTGWVEPSLVESEELVGANA